MSGGGKSIPSWSLPNMDVFQELARNTLLANILHYSINKSWSVAESRNLVGAKPAWLEPAVVALLASVVLHLFILHLLHQYFNLNTRSLYPYRWWNIKAEVTSELKRLGYLKHRAISLPIELWEVIIYEAIHIPSLFDTSCEPCKFHLFIIPQFTKRKGSLYQDSERLRKSLRLVCRSWNAILSKEGGRWVDMDLHEDLIIPRQAKGISLSITRHSIFDAPPRNNPTLSLENVEQQFPIAMTVHCNSYTITDEDYAKIFPRTEKLIELRSFTFSATWGVVGQLVWDGLERSFSLLTVLILDCYHISGVLSLEHLEILYLNVNRPDLEGWYLPNLQQLALGESSTRHDFVLQRPILNSLDKLQSLLLYKCFATLKADEAFWSSYPFLQFLGVRSNLFHIIDPPSSTHPLSHLYFEEPDSALLNIPHALDTISKLPNLQSVTLPPYSDADFKGPEDWHTLLHSLEKRGIVSLDKQGQRIQVPYHRTHIPLQEWERPLLALSMINVVSFFLEEVVDLHILPVSWWTYRVMYFCGYGAWQLSRNKIL